MYICIYTHIYQRGYAPFRRAWAVRFLDWGCGGLSWINGCLRGPEATGKGFGRVMQQLLVSGPPRGRIIGGGKLLKGLKDKGLISVISPHLGSKARRIYIHLYSFWLNLKRASAVSMQNTIGCDRQTLLTWRVQLLPLSQFSAFCQVTS